MASKKEFSVFLIAVMVSGVVFGHFGIVQAESTIPKPSVPEFTVTIFDSLYDKEPAITTNPYTGKTVTTESSHIELRTVELRIKNETFRSLYVTK
jgi:hypothetical protein